jgi:hypothetical protein
MSLLSLALAFARRAPDLEIGGHGNPYLRRWFVIPRNRLCNIYLHQFLRDDDDRALHDHPWGSNCSVLLDGRYIEVLFRREPVHGDPLPPQTRVVRRPGWLVFRRAATAHRVELFRDAEGRPMPVWSLFLTGPMLRSWGFWCPAGRWVHWRSFTAGPRGEVVGAGCGDPTASTQ